MLKKRRRRQQQPTVAVLPFFPCALSFVWLDSAWLGFHHSLFVQCIEYIYSSVCLCAFSMQPIPSHFKLVFVRSPHQCDYILRNWFLSVAQNIFYCSLHCSLSVWAKPLSFIFRPRCHFKMWLRPMNKMSIKVFVQLQQFIVLRSLLTILKGKKWCDLCSVYAMLCWTITICILLLYARNLELFRCHFSLSHPPSRSTIIESKTTKMSPTSVALSLKMAKNPLDSPNFIFHA